jgi:capsular exopolysaccharide synthesis family protein
LITSTQNGEGKTTTALNLAQALAQRKVSVLLIDCDFRKGGVATALGRTNEIGLTSVLNGGINISHALRALLPNLWVLPAGPVPANPVAMLASKEMTSMLERLAAQFDFVIIDSPPVLAVTDASVLAGSVDGVLLVAASGTTPRTGLVRARKILEASGAKILGLAVNKLDPRRPGHGYSYSAYSYK